MKPRLFFGHRASPQILEAGASYLDRGITYHMLAKSVRLAPGGPSGECVFAALFLTIVHFADVRIFVRPIIDGVALPAQLFTLVADGPVTGPFTESYRTVTVVEVGLSQAYMVGGVERLRTLPRGTWIEVEVQSAMADMQQTYLRVDAAEVEHEVVVAPARPVGATP